MRAAQVTAWRARLEIGELPDPEPPETGVVIEILACGVCRSDWHAWTGADPDVRPGEWMAVFGGGGGSVGMAAMLLGRAPGARVMIVDVVDDKLALATQLGADAVVNAAKCDAPEAIREITGGGADVAIEALGIAETTVVTDMAA